MTSAGSWEPGGPPMREDGHDDRCRLRAGPLAAGVILGRITLVPEEGEPVDGAWRSFAWIARPGPVPVAIHDSTGAQAEGVIESGWHVLQPESCRHARRHRRRQPHAVGAGNRAWRARPIHDAVARTIARWPAAARRPAHAFPKKVAPARKGSSRSSIASSITAPRRGCWEPWRSRSCGPRSPSPTAAAAATWAAWGAVATWAAIGGPHMSPGGFGGSRPMPGGFDGGGRGIGGMGGAHGASTADARSTAARELGGLDCAAGRPLLPAITTSPAGTFEGRFPADRQPRPGPRCDRRDAVRPMSMDRLANRGDAIRSNFYHGGWMAAAAGTAITSMPGGRAAGGAASAGAWWQASPGAISSAGAATAACPWPTTTAPTSSIKTTACTCRERTSARRRRMLIRHPPLPSRGRQRAWATMTSGGRWASMPSPARRRRRRSTFVSLAIDKAGLLRGTYYDAVSDTTQNITGKVEKKSQRAAWTIGDKKTPVYEAGLANLTQQQTTILVHRDAGKVEQMLLVRVEDPKQAAAGSP